jgi:hypothetical protein
VGLCLIFAFFLILLLLQEEKFNDVDRRTYRVMLTIVLAALAVTYAFFLIVPVFFIPVWAAILFFTGSGRARDRSIESLKVIVPCAVAAVVVAPYLFAVMRGGSVVTAGQSMSTFHFFYFDTQGIRDLIVFLLPSPLIAAGLWFGYKRLSFSRKFLFLLSGSLIFLFLTTFLRLNWANEAKFNYVLSFFFSFLFVFSLTRLLALFPRRWMKGAVVVCIVLYLLATPVITEAAYICSPWFRDTTYAFDGRHIVFAGDNSRNEAYEWIRHNTPRDALLMMPYLDTPHGITIAEAVSYRPSALSERSLFVVKDVYAYLLPEYEERVRIRDRIFRDPEDAEVKKYLASLKRPVYLLMETGYDDPLLKGVAFDGIPERYSKDFTLVFHNEKQKVYRVTIGE